MKPLPRGKMDWHGVFMWAGILRLDVGSMSLFELTAAIDGYCDSKGIKRTRRTISDERLASTGIEGF